MRVLALAVAASAWVAALLSGPVLPAHAAAALYAFGSLICHQLAARSFHLAGAQLPVCGRCFGIYSGVAAALWLVLAGRSSHADRSDPRVVLIAAAVPTVVTVAIEWGGVAPLSNVTRALAGAVLGAAIGLVVGRAARYTTVDARHDR